MKASSSPIGTKHALDADCLKARKSAHRRPSRLSVGFGLSRPRRSGFRSGEIPGVSVFDRAFDRTRLRIELPRPDCRARQVSGRLAFFDLLRGLGFCPFAGPGFGHGVSAFPGCWGKLNGFPAEVLTGDHRCRLSYGLKAAEDDHPAIKRARAFGTIRTYSNCAVLV